MTHARQLLYVIYLPPVDGSADSGLGVDLTVLDRSDTGVDGADELPFQVRWTDRVANVWTENYADLAVAFARAALVLRATQRGAMFLHHAGDDAQLLDGCPGPSGFVHDALTFLDDQLEG